GRHLRQLAPVIERHAVSMSHQLERPPTQVDESFLCDLLPILGQLFFGRSHGIGQQLQDVLAWYAVYAARTRSLRNQRRRLSTGKLRRRCFSRLSEIVAQPLEYCSAQKPVVSERAVLHLGVHHRFDPGRLRLLDRHRQRGCLPDQGVEALSHLARDGLRIAAPSLTSIEQAISLPATDIKG